MAEEERPDYGMIAEEAKTRTMWQQIKDGYNKNMLKRLIKMTKKRIEKLPNTEDGIVDVKLRKELLQSLRLLATIINVEDDEGNELTYEDYKRIPTKQLIEIFKVNIEFLEERV